MRQRTLQFNNYSQGELPVKRILITGNAGYIGSHLSRLLHEQGYEVHGMDLNLPDQTIFQHYQQDITHQLQGYYSRFDCIVHLAALVQVGESRKNPYDYYNTNIMGTARVLGIPHDNFIFASTGCAPAAESPYAISKLAAEQIVEELEVANYTIFRFYNVIGTSGFRSTNPDGLMLRLQEAVKTGTFTIYGCDYDTPDGTAIRDYVHVDEICHAIAQAIEIPANQVENLGHGTGYTVREIVDQFCETNKVSFRVVEGRRRQGDLERSVLDKPSRYMKKLYDIGDLLRV